MDIYLEKVLPEAERNMLLYQIFSLVIIVIFMSGCIDFQTEIIYTIILFAISNRFH